MREVGQANLGSSVPRAHSAVAISIQPTPRIKREEPGEQVPVWRQEMLLSPSGWAGGPATLGTP